MAQSGFQANARWWVGIARIVFMAIVAVIFFWFPFPGGSDPPDRHSVAVSCKILESAVEVVKDSDGNRCFSPLIRYSYEYGGVSLTGERAHEFRFYSEAQELTDKYPAGSHGICFVDPKLPSSAVLEIRKGSSWFRIVAISAFLLILVVSFFRSPASRSAPEGPVSVEKPKPAGLAGVFGCIGCFGMLAGVFSAPFFLYSGWQSVRSASWETTPCVVEWSEVARYEGEDSQTYRANILFSYHWGGRPYKSNWYNLSAHSSSWGRPDAQKAVHNHPAGKKTHCFVNPSNPYEAVIDRETSGWETLIFLIAVTVTIFGFGGAYFLKPRQGASPQGFAGEGVPSEIYSPALSGPIRDSESSAVRDLSVGGSNEPAFSLKPGVSGQVNKWAGVVILFFFALIWNLMSWAGFISVLFPRSGSPTWFVALFLLPFVAIGLFLIGVFSLPAEPFQSQDRDADWKPPASPRRGHPCFLEDFRQDRTDEGSFHTPRRQ